MLIPNFKKDPMVTFFVKDDLTMSSAAASAGTEGDLCAIDEVCREVCMMLR